MQRKEQGEIFLFIIFHGNFCSISEVVFHSYPQNQVKQRTLSSFMKLKNIHNEQRYLKIL